MFLGAYSLESKGFEPVGVGTFRVFQVLTPTRTQRLKYSA